MSFNESNTGEQMILDAVGNPGCATAYELRHKTRNCRELKFIFFTKFSFGSKK